MIHNDFHEDVVANQHQHIAINQEKMIALLSNSKMNLNTRNLVALALLTRMNADEKCNIMRLMLDSTEWFVFNVRLLQLGHPSLIRLACHWVSLSRNFRHNWDLMTHTLVRAIKDRSSLPIATTDEDLLYALVCSVRLKGSMEIADLDAVWHRFSSGSQITTVDTLDIENSALSNDHWRFVDDVLTKLLHNWNQNSWMPSFLCLYELIAPEIPSIPLWYQSMFPLVLSMNSHHSQLHDWHKLLLESTTLIAVFKPDLTSAIGNISKSLSDIIMVHIGSPHSDLYHQAWDTCSVLVSQWGWDWIPRADDRALLCETSHLCIWTRLAAGEYCMQLNLINSDKGDSYQTQTLDACGRVVASAIREAVKEADRLESGAQRFLDANALQHLRESFRVTLEVSINHVANDKATNDVPCTVLGLLLSEYSIWDALAETISMNTLLFAIKNCILNNSVQVLPCLVDLLDQASLNEERVHALRGVGILGDNLMSDFFCHFWRDLAVQHQGFIPWACAAIVNWLSVAHPTLIQRQVLAEHVLQWTKQSTETRVAGVTYKTSGSAALACYFKIVGSCTPHAHDAVVIHNGL